ncbi:hypothetical protein [Sorangium sp. So ce1151]|uniref:hypothetical protein n=1 Tax=unclassified Sorangium TaxID=2621164 RepID=UPI003F6482DE
MQQIVITKEDLDGISRKLDEFGAVLTERERTVLLATFGIAAQAIAQASKGAAPVKAGAAAPLPPLSVGFRKAFESGVGTRFTLEDVSGDAESVRNVQVDWGNAAK